MGKAASPVKKAPGALNGKAAPNGSREVVRARSFDDSLCLDGRVERVESTIVNRETATHLAFAKSRKDDFAFAPSPHYVQVLNNYCHWDRDASHSSILVVVGQPGNGKSALLAHWAEERRRSEEGSEELIYEHYAGCSYDSVKLSLFLFRFMTQIKATIILVLDGIDCIRNEEGGDSLSWLPTSFPANVRIIVSATQTTVRGKNHLHCCKWVIRKPIVYDDDDDLVYDTTLPPQDHDSHSIRELRRRQSTFIVVEPLDEHACRAILHARANATLFSGRDGYEEKYLRTIGEDEKEQIVTSPGSSSPLYVRLLLHALELFEPAQDEKRKHWLKTATQTNELHAIYELLMKQWNEILLADLYDSYNRYRASFDAVNSNAMRGVFAPFDASRAIQQDDDNSPAADRKLTCRSGKRDVLGEQSGAHGATRTSSTHSSSISSANTMVQPDPAELESLQIAIEQRALLVRHALSLLAVTRYGLTDADFAKLFGDSVPKHVCQQLLKLLRPHVMQIRRHDCKASAGNVSTTNSNRQMSSSSSSSNNNPSTNIRDVVLLNDLSHNQLRLITRYGFLRDDHLRSCYYRELANYFEAMDACQRRVDELPVQLECYGGASAIDKGFSRTAQRLLQIDLAARRDQPARDPNTIENAETIVNKLKQDVIDLQQKAQVVSHEKRLAGIEVPKLLQVIQDKSKIHQTALARLRFRQELSHRMHSNLIANKLSTFAGSSNQALHDDIFDAQSSPVKNSMMGFADAAGGEDSSTADLRSSELISGGGRRTTSIEDMSFLCAKDKLLHKKETAAERQKKAESLKMYVGSAYKDDGILDALRQVGINKPEDAQVYWQDQLDHAAQLEGEEKAGEQRVTETRELLATLQAQFVNLKLGGCSSGNELALNGGMSGATACGTGSGASSANGASGASSEGGGASKSHSIKVLEQQLAETVASNQQKKEHSARLKLLSEKLHLGLLHVAQIVGVISAQQMDSLALGDSIEQVVRLFLGDESHLQSSSSTNLRRENSTRVMGLVNQAGSHPFLPPDTRTASDKIRYNVRVLKHQTRSMNPYVGDGGKSDDNDDEEGESDNDAYDSARLTTSGSAGDVKKRQDIKNQSKMELHKKETERKRTEKKRKA